MIATFDHVQYNAANMGELTSFYKDLLGYFEMKTLFDGGEQILGMSDGSVGFWVLPGGEGSYNRDAAGLNHIGLKVSSREDVDRFHSEFMQPRGIEAQFETPRQRADFGPTYYQVMFVDPQGLAIEVFVP